MIVTYDITVCEECALMLANGEGSEEHNGKMSVGIDEYDEFSWHPCQGCGSKLAGSRFGAVVLGFEEEV